MKKLRGIGWAAINRLRWKKIAEKMAKDGIVHYEILLIEDQQAAHNFQPFFPRSSSFSNELQ